LGLPFGALAQEEYVSNAQVITTDELQALIGGPTLVNFAGTNVPAKAAIQALASTVKGKPTAYSEVVNQRIDALGNISVDWKDMPFWEAARDVEYMADGRWHAGFGGSPDFLPNDGGQDQNQEIGLGLDGLPGAETAFVKVVASSLTRTSRSKVFVGDNEALGAATPDRIVFVMNTYHDPKLNILAVLARQLKFQSKPNAPVVDSSRVHGGVYLSYHSNGTAVSKHYVDFPEGMAIGPKSRFFRVSGVLHTVIATTSETWNIPDMVAAGKVTRTIAGGQYSLDNVEIKNNRLTAKLTVSRPAGQKGLTIQSVRISSNPIQVRDAQGRELHTYVSTASFEENGTMKGELLVNLRTDKNENAVGPYSFEWIVPTQERSYDVPFEFRNLPMP
jgi:hypothetical protein